MHACLFLPDCHQGSQLRVGDLVLEVSLQINIYDTQIVHSVKVFRQFRLASTTNNALCVFVFECTCVTCSHLDNRHHVYF